MGTVQIPPSLEGFLAATGWPTPTDRGVRHRMELAYGYFLCTVPHPYLALAPDGTVNVPGSKSNYKPGPWDFNLDGCATKLASWMMSIDFRSPISTRYPVGPDDLLRRYKLRPFEQVETSPFFTFENRSSAKLGYMPGAPWEPVKYRTYTRVFKPRSRFECMLTKIADAYVDWVRMDDPWYSRGGGVQLFIWNPGDRVEIAAA